ncbi:MAG: nucleotidyltransferase family protein [Acidobacteria bacterium]|nr:nucleotidyltransferase family protein [Acidobacteriota bacterium]
MLAAGEGRRMGGPKALLPIGDTSFLAHICSLVARPRVAAVVAVIGAEAERVRAEARLPEGVVVVENEIWREGMLSSVWCGLDEAESRGADGILLHPVDHPVIASETVDRVVTALHQGALVAVPVHGGRRGHPGGFSRDAFGSLRAAPANLGARAVLAEHRTRVVEVEGDAGCLLGVNTPADYRRVAGR